jgi:flagellin FlaB
MRYTEVKEMKRFTRYDEGFTGLEAAIVLIAFVVVAAVFSYVVLGAGFFTTQKSQETVHTAVGQASTSLELVGNVYGAGSGTSALKYIQITVATTAGGGSLDLSKLTVTYRDDAAFDEIAYDATNSKLDGTEATVAPTVGNWIVSQVLNGKGSTQTALLEPGTQFTLQLHPPTGANTNVNQKFTIELKPAIGAVLPISRTVPAAIESVNQLY